MTTARKPIHRRLYEGWLLIAAHFGEIQTQVILMITYVLVIGPVSLGLAVARKDLLHKRQVHGGKSAWNVADTAAPDLGRARRLF